MASAYVLSYSPDMTNLDDIYKTIDALRDGKRKLPSHVGMALAAYAGKPVLPEQAVQDITQMLKGIRLYQENAYKRTVEPLKTVWQDGEVRLLHAPFAGDKKATLFIVPSMINRSTILDLMPGKSFIRWLAERGCDAYLLDWGNPVQDKGMESMDDVIGKRLLPALSYLVKREGVPVHVLGYCMGGTLLAAAASLQPELIKATVFLAAPWDFHAGDDKPLTTQVQLGAVSGLQMIDNSGILPVDWIQSVFAAVNADRTVGKFANFAAREDFDDEGASLFVAVEEWLNDGVDLPGGVARSCIMDWYNQNKPGLGTWKIMGQVIDLSRLHMPTLIVASARDRLVPRDSSLALRDTLPQSDTYEPVIGHIGMMSGRRAEHDVWLPLLRWLEKTA